MTRSVTPREGSELVALLRARGQRVTSQRLVILRELRRLGGHVTAERVFQAARRDLPGTAVPTVYATLELLVQLGLARRLDFGAAALYDARTDPHQHAVCRQCGCVEDVDGDAEATALLRAAEDRGFRPDRAELTIYGLCSRCGDAGARPGLTS